MDLREGFEKIQPDPLFVQINTGSAVVFLMASFLKRRKPGPDTFARRDGCDAFILRVQRNRKVAPKTAMKDHWSQRIDITAPGKSVAIEDELPRDPSFLATLERSAIPYDCMS
jgi:hypothetical protein